MKPIARLRHLVLTAGVGSIVAISVALGGFGADTSALCNGTGNPYAQWVGGSYNVDERPQSGTCNADYEYRGEYRDTRVDGQDVYIRYNQNGIWRVTASNPSFNWWGYAYTDANRYSPTQLCGTSAGCYSTQFYNSGF